MPNGADSRQMLMSGVFVVQNVAEPAHIDVLAAQRAIQESLSLIIRLAATLRVPMRVQFVIRTIFDGHIVRGLAFPHTLERGLTTLFGRYPKGCLLTVA